MVACLVIPAFSLRAALRSRPELHGERDALGTCPQLVLAEQDPAGVEEEWERILRRLEEAGFGVEPEEPGCVFFETRGVERLAGGLQAALRRALDAVGEAW